VVLGFDRQGWITVFAALLLALITLFANDAHSTVATAIEQQVGIQRSTSTWSAAR
jgi:hypothetical protein